MPSEVVYKPSEKVGKIDIDLKKQIPIKTPFMISGEWNKIRLPEYSKMYCVITDVIIANDHAVNNNRFKLTNDNTGMNVVFQIKAESSVSRSFKTPFILSPQESISASIGGDGIKYTLFGYYTDQIIL